MSDKPIELIDVDRLRPSPTQPRKHFGDKELEELTNSMRQHGFAFGALLVRPLSGETLLDESGERSSVVCELFEIVIGERRARAAKLAGISKVPCSVRVLSDSRVVELQLIENLQRSDLNAIEEADGYKKLMELVDEKSGELLYPTVARAAIAIGRDEAVVAKRLPLCNLEGEARAAVESGQLPPRTAYLIARIPSRSLRAEAAQKILHPIAGNIESGVLSLRDAETLIAAEFQRDLRRAPFDQDDASLVPLRTNELQTRIAGGACHDCPYKSANIPGTESKRKHSCLNPTCFDEKIEAEWNIWQTKHTDAARKRRALGRTENASIFSKEFPAQPNWSSGLVNLDQFPASDDLKAGEGSPLPWRGLIEGADLEVIVGRDANGKTHELVKREMAIAAAKLNGHEFLKSNDRDPKTKPTRKALGLEAPTDMPAHEREEWLEHQASRDEVDEQRKKSEMAKSEAEARGKLIANNCFDALRKKTKVMTTDFLRFAALFVYGCRAPNEQLLKRYKLPVAENISRNIERWTTANLVAFIVELILTDSGYNFDFDDEDRTWLKLLGVDMRAEEKRIAQLDKKFKASDKKTLAKALKK